MLRTFDALFWMPHPADAQLRAIRSLMQLDIAQVALNWRYYRLGKQLRIDMEEFRKLIVGLGEAKQLTKDLASKILIDNASKFFNVRDVKNAILGSIAP